MDWLWETGYLQGALSAMAKLCPKQTYDTFFSLRLRSGYGVDREV